MKLTGDVAVRTAAMMVSAGIAAPVCGDSSSGVDCCSLVEADRVGVAAPREAVPYRR